MTVRFDPASPERFRDFIARDFGLSFDDAKLAFLGDVLKRRAETLAKPVEVYLAELEAGSAPPGEVGALAEELTVGETYFFRNGDQFRAFREIVLPERMQARAASARLRFLSAGCSSGEEAFSLAIIAREAVPSPPWQVSIRAVDVNPAALRKAAGGRFTNWALRDTPPAVQQKWFTPQGRDLMLSDDIRAGVQFDQRNLMDAASDVWVEDAYDAVFCRNVVMYFSPAIQQEVIGRIACSLVPGGYLFLGHAETLRGLSQEFHLVHTHDTFYYRRKAEGDEAPPLYLRGDNVRRLAPAAPLPPAVVDTGWYAAIGRATERIEALSRTPDPVVPPLVAKPAWSLGLALDLLQRERFAEALDLIRAMPAEAGVDPDVLLLQATLLVHGGKLAAAAEVCRVLLAGDEMNAGANYVLALCFEGVGDRTAATHHYRVASYLDPNFAMPRLHLGLLARRGGEMATAKEDLTQALDLLRREDASRLLLFGGGFTRDALIALCEAELKRCGARA